MSVEQDANTNKIDVAYVAMLARIELSDQECATFQAQLDHIVDYVRKLGELDLSGIEPTSHASAVNNVFREDAVVPGLPGEQVMKNAPASVGEQFRVPKIVE